MYVRLCFGFDIDLREHWGDAENVHMTSKNGDMFNNTTTLHKIYQKPKYKLT